MAEENNQIKNQDSAEEKKRNIFKNKFFIFGIIFLILAIAGVAFFAIQKLRKPATISVLEESSSMKKSASDEWWLNSGGIMDINQEGFSTVIGSLDQNNYWRKLYAKNNPKDTDDGYHPQNIFRLVTRNQWQNFSQSIYFKIDELNLSQSKNRNASNGVLLFNRYQDGDNLYYAGIRVDGDVVIKKKIEGTYYTMIEKDVFTNGKKYAITDNPNQIPVNQWMGIKTEVRNIDQNTVNIRLFMDKTGNGNWELVLETQDAGNKYGKAPFLNQGYAGIRTDFMDVYFKNYSIDELK